MDFMGRLHEVAEAFGIKEEGGQGISQEALDKFDKIMGDDMLGNLDISDKRMPEMELSEGEGKFESLFEGEVELRADVQEEVRSLEKELTEEEKQLLPEIYSSETEFAFSEFDFEDKNLHKILKYFDKANWEGLQEEDRKAVVSALVGQLAVGLELSTVPKVEIRKGLPPNCYGSYNERTNTIKINAELLKHPENAKYLVNTIAHEMRHAYQWERAKKGETHQDVLYKLNFHNYIQPKRGKDGKYFGMNEYQNQLVEAEARDFADKIVELMEGKR